jgi:hypothetical protein
VAQLPVFLALYYMLRTEGRDPATATSDVARTRESALNLGSGCYPQGARPKSGPETPAIPTNGDKHPQTANN